MLLLRYVRSPKELENHIRSPAVRRFSDAFKGTPAIRRNCRTAREGKLYRQDPKDQAHKQHKVPKIRKKKTCAPRVCILLRPDSNFAPPTDFPPPYVREPCHSRRKVETLPTVCPESAPLIWQHFVGARTLGGFFMVLSSLFSQ